MLKHACTCSCGVSLCSFLYGGLCQNIYSVLEGLLINTPLAAIVSHAHPHQPSTTGRQQGGTGSGPPGSSELLDDEDKMLLDRINHLASDLSAEMKEAVQVRLNCCLKKGGNNGVYVCGG